jgi:hypothetical protein
MMTSSLDATSPIYVTEGKSQTAPTYARKEVNQAGNEVLANQCLDNLSQGWAFEKQKGCLNQIGISRIGGA